ncbi:MAG: biopolymer transport protein ExbD [Lacunisphaera sp.]|jgi:biopolymer transport protein ExbD|nr:biopolymer transport protein ExbD [Lacunisphaera sp.]
MHGGGGGTGPGGIKRARIEIIPLIDVIFFLLATFVLFTLSLNKSNGVTVQLPVSATGEVRDPNGTVTVSVTDEGTLAWNKDLVTLDEFLIRLQQYHQQEPDGRILINGDERAFFAQAVYVFDQARIVGFKRIFIETRSH